MFSFANVNNSFALVMKFSDILCRLALLAWYLITAPIPSHADFPCDVAKKCQVQGMPKSDSWYIMFAKTLNDLYWAEHPSVK